ncbi:unnamed protein product [Caenorhabditis sp. 36 PRJEB53466]|nr:unnamed protein product [Caenorhabditis sp. 36 PRJEB53466]
MLHRYLLLLLLLGPVIDTLKIRNAVKKVGKRFGLENTIIETFEEIALKEPFYNASDEEVAEIKKDHAMTVSQWLRGQASSENPASQAFGALLMSVLDKDMSADVCGATPFTFYQFVDFLKLSRPKWKKNLEKDDAEVKIMPDKDREKLRFVTSFVQESKYGYTSRQIYEINMTLSFPDKRGKILYTISSMSVKGGCTEHGTVEKDNIPSWSIDTDVWTTSDVYKFLLLFTPIPFRGQHQDPHKIPSFWLKGLEIDEHLSVTVCNPKTGNTRRYTRDEFLRWYELFGKLWHAKDDKREFADIQRVHRTEVDVIARVTYRLVPGLDWDGKAKEVDWNMLITGKYDMHGNRGWYPIKVDVSCPPGINLLEVNYEAYRNITGLTLVSMIPFTKRVYQNIGFLDYLIKNGSQVELLNCEGERMDTIKDLEKNFWDPMSNYSSTSLESVSMDTEEGLAREDTYFTMYVGMRAYDRIPQRFDGSGDRTSIFETTWHFYIYWDEVDMFYYIKRIEFGCLDVQRVTRQFGWPLRGMFVRSLLPLLLLLGHLADARALGNALKRVGKRFGLEAKYVSKLSEYDQLRENYQNATDEQVAEIKKDHAIRMSIWLRGQASDKNPDWRVFEEQLLAVLDKDLSADICGSTAYGYVQFVSYLKNNRRNWEASPEKDESSYEVKPSGKNVISMTSSFKQRSKYGYFSTQVYQIRWKLTFPEDLPHVYYTVSSISVMGGCTEHGEVDPALTNMKDVQTEVWNNTNAQKFFLLFTPGPYQGTEQKADRIPQFWLKRLDKSGRLKASVCRANGTGAGEYTEDEFFRWYRRFTLLWHPKPAKDGNFTTDYVKIQTLEHTPARIIARVTMQLQPGVDEKADETEWDFKVVGDYNVHGDELWHISEVDVMCPPALTGTLQQHNYESCRDIVAVGFASMVSNEMQWSTGLEILKHFINTATIEVESCGAKMDNLNDLEKYLWQQDGPYSHKIIGYTIAREGGLTADDDTHFSMFVGMRGWKDTPKLAAHFEGEWKLFVHWDEKDQFYYIRKLDFACPIDLVRLHEYAPITRNQLVMNRFGV